VRDTLTAHGRTVAKGAIAWIWSRHERSIPLPGFRNAAQVEDNAGALEHGSLEPQEFAIFGLALGRATWERAARSGAHDV
jgi:aryl-alcohol dehydrogenase-like predicted oxidoreductase